MIDSGRAVNTNIRKMDTKKAADGVVSSTKAGRDSHINSSFAGGFSEINGSSARGGAQGEKTPSKYSITYSGEAVNIAGSGHRILYEINQVHKIDPENLRRAYRHRS